MGKDERKIEAFELYKQGLPLVDIARKLDALLRNTQMNADGQRVLIPNP